jgi:polyphosphate kinase
MQLSKFKTMNRFVVLPHLNKQYVILIDDVIRHNLKSVFNIFEYESVSAHMIKSVVMPS